MLHVLTTAVFFTLMSVAVAQTTAPTTRPALLLKKGEPAFALWDGGIYLLGRPRRMLFAAWPDGTVAREVGHSFRPGRVLHNAKDQTVGREMIPEQEFLVGRVPPARVQALIDEAVAAGFDALPALGSVRPDGPAQIMEIRRDGQTLSRTHDPTTRPAADRDRSSRPRAAYGKLWRRVRVATDAMRPADEQPLRTAVP